jgi:hypothetical protein
MMLNADSMSASILPEYLSSTAGKMVDYVMSVEACNETPGDSTGTGGVLAAIEELRRQLPAGVINHTDFIALRNRPIAVSIETKRRGRGQEAAANLQMGTWHAAQWRFLQSVVGEEEIKSLPFLPGLTIHGHQWAFVASTFVNGKTVSGSLS